MDAIKRTNWLATTIMLVTAALLLGLLGRVAWIQRHVTPELLEKLNRQYTAVIPLPADRREILFADGTPAAMSVRMYNLFADPAFIMDIEGKLNPLKDGQLEEAKAKLAQALSPLVNKSPDELRFEIERNTYYKREISPGQWVDTDIPRRFLWLAREVDEDFYNRFEILKEKLREESREIQKTEGKSKDPAVRIAAAKKAAVLYHTLDGVGFVRSMKRMYPMGQLAGSVIGFANRYEGVDGMEHQLDDLLKGIPGQMLVTKDAGRHTLLIQDERYTPADDGRPVWLTIDTVVQGIAEEQLQQAVTDHGAASGTAVVMDPFNGHILAIANFPSFDPAQFGKADPNTRRDRAVTDPYEPGSIFKPFVMAWALEKHVVKPTDVFVTHENYYDPTGRLVRDTAEHGTLSVAEILIYSSNVGMTQIGWKMGIPTLYEAVTKFGFGQRTGVELPGDQKGLVKPLAQWNKGTLTSASFGYEVATTPLQLVRAFATFANGGYLVTPRVINAVEEKPGKVVPWSDLSRASNDRGERIISVQTSETMRNIMADVLVHGTAKSAASKVYKLYGKTGTAHVAAGSHGQGGRGYGESDYDSSFLCGGPVSAPKVVTIVTLHKPDLQKGYYGGTVAAPAATAIVERTLMYMQVPGDQPPIPIAKKR